MALVLPLVLFTGEHWENNMSGIPLIGIDPISIGIEDLELGAGGEISTTSGPINIVDEVQIADGVYGFYSADGATGNLTIGNYAETNQIKIANESGSNKGVILNNSERFDVNVAGVNVIRIDDSGDSASFSNTSGEGFNVSGSTFSITVDLKIDPGNVLKIGNTTVLNGQMPYDGAPTATSIRDALIAVGLMAAS